jgi:hypothetical protein
MTLDDPWFTNESAQDAAETVVRLAKELWEKQGRARIGLAEDCLALYLGSTRHSLSGSGNPLALLDLIGQDASSFNVIQAITDTKINATLKNKVRPMFITESADSETKRKAAAMQADCDGVTYEVGLTGWLRRAVCKAGFLFEGGGVEWTADLANDRILATPVWCWEFFVPRREARYGNPRQLFARHAIDRAVLLSYLKDADKEVIQAVKDANAADARDVQDDARDPKLISDQVIVYKAWHLPSGKVDLDDPRAYGKSESGRSAKPNHDGRHIVAIDGGKGGSCTALVDIPWPHDIFPVSWFKPNMVPASWWSRGEPEVLANVQIELNRWAAREARVVDKHAVPRTFVDKKSGINPAQITNSTDNIFLTNGPPGQAILTEAAPAVPPDLVTRAQRIIQNARDQRGISEMAMTAKKPAGVNHEPGMQYLADTESERHTEEFEAWEDFNLANNKNIIRCRRDLAEHNPRHEVLVTANQKLRRYRYRDIDLGDSFAVKLWPTNWLKEDPAERADQIADFVDRGILPPEAMIDAVDDPDLAALLGNRIAMQRNIENILDRICEDGYGENEQPSPYLDLQKAKQLGIQRWNELCAENEDWKTILNVTKFLEDVDAMIAKASAPTAPALGQGDTLGALGPGAAAPPPPGPGGPPMPPPGAAPMAAA